MNMFDRLANGPGGNSGQGGSYDNWNDMVGSAPPGNFRNAVNGAMRQMDPDEYYRHSQPGIDGTDPFGRMQEPERQGLAERLLGSLFGRGVGEEEIARNTGVRTLDPRRMSPDELASVTQWTQRNHPDAFGDVAEQYRDKPNMLESLLGNRAVQMALIGLGAKILMDRSRR
jgi:hypothetical protein